MSSGRVHERSVEMDRDLWVLRWDTSARERSLGLSLSLSSSPLSECEEEERERVRFSSFSLQMLDRGR